MFIAYCYVSIRGIESDDDIGKYVLSTYKYNNESIDAVTNKLFEAYKEKEGGIINKDVVNQI